MTRRVMVSVYAGVPWPADEAVVAFAGHEIRLIPPVRNPHPGIRSTYPMAVIDRAEGEPEDAVRVIRRFLNALAWREQAFIREIDVTYGGPLLRMSTNVPDGGVTQCFDAGDLPDPQDEKARTALALYREGQTLEDVHIAYAFLSHFKVLNVRFKTGPEQVQWIDAHAAALRSARAVRRAHVLTAAHGAFGAYLYGSGRCAVAHAFATPVVSPDDIADQRRLSADLPVIRELAAILLQKEYGMAKPRAPAI